MNAQSWHVTYQFGNQTYSADFKVVSGQTETEEQIRMHISRRNPTWQNVQVELRGPHKEDPGPTGVEGTPGE